MLPFCVFASEYIYAGHRNDTFYVRCALSPDEKYLLSGSGQNTGVIWQVCTLLLICLQQIGVLNQLNKEK